MQAARPTANGCKSSSIYSLTGVIHGHVHGYTTFKISHLVFHPNFTLLFKLLDEMSEYWLISVPGDVKEGHPSWDMLKSKIGALSNIWRFHIPADLKVTAVNLFLICQVTRLA